MANVDLIIELATTKEIDEGTGANKFSYDVTLNKHLYPLNNEESDNI